MRAFLRRLCGNAAEADDLAQETFVFAWENLHRFDSARDFRPWLFGIAWRKYREKRRGWRRLLARETAYVQSRETVAHGDPGLKLDLEAACAALPADQRAAILLCLGLDFTHQEAAEALALYWLEPGRRPYLIRVDGQVAGFALVRALERPGLHELAEFYVGQAFRRQGVGRAAAWTLFEGQPGDWQLNVLTGNRNALAFWLRVVPCGTVPLPVDDPEAWPHLRFRFHVG